MTLETIFMLVGFLLAAYAVVGNDSIQTLGTFMASNQKRPWWVLFLFASTVMCATILYGWFSYGGDPSFGRLETKFPPFEEIDFNWYHLISPLVLLLLTRLGFPVSTSFLVLIIFSPGALGPMFTKTVMGYGIAFGLGLVLYLIVVTRLEKLWAKKPYTVPPLHWVLIQWCSTAFLWFNWLRQDLANIFIYLPRPIELWGLLLALAWMVAVQAFIFYTRGGAIQQVVLQKYNTTDIRSATIIDFLYGLVLLWLKEYSQIPMSTTWVFIGLLAGRELGIRLVSSPATPLKAAQLIGKDLFKAGVGLGLSVLLAYFLPWIDSILRGE